MKEAATNAELHFKEVAERKGLNLEFQVPVYIKYKKAIQRFYIVDFMDKEHKIIFEIDGEYHDTYEQKKKDWFRTRDLNSLGYTVYRISNNDVFLGKTTAFLYKIYLAKGIDISKIM